MINAVTDIQEDTTVEIVINVQPLGDEDVEIRPHSLSVHSYKTPTFCNFCGEMLFGMIKQVRKLLLIYFHILSINKVFISLTISFLITFFAIYLISLGIKVRGMWIKLS